MALKAIHLTAESPSCATESRVQEFLDDGKSKVNPIYSREGENPTISYTDGSYSMLLLANLQLSLVAVAQRFFVV
jgi:hypothetical protein